MAMATLASMTVRLGIDTDQLRAGAASAKNVLTGLGKAVGGLAVGGPAAAATTAAVGGMAAAFASAGIAAKAFQLAVGPQMKDVSEAAGLAEEAQKAAAAGSEDAAEKQKAYTDALAAMPPHTRAMAKEFIGLKKDHQQWSDSLSSSTMPVYTKGLQVIRRLLPLLTPFVKAASKAFGEFIDEIDRSTQGKGMEQFAASMAKVAGSNLKSLLTGLKNIGVGIGGVIKAFLPLSTTMSGGFEQATAAFAKWGQGLSNSEGFAQFVALAKQGGQTLGTLATAALKLLVAVAPLIGVTATIALYLARMVNAIPPGVLQVLATTIVSVVIAMKLWSAGAAAVGVANRLMASSTYTAIAGWARMMAAGLMAYARIAAAAVLSAARTAAAWAGAALRSMATFVAQLIRTALVAVAQFVMMAARAVIWAATMAAQWLIAMGPVGWIIAAVIALVALIVANWDKVKAWTIAIWDAVWAFIKGAVDKVLAGIAFLGQIPGKIAEWFGQAKDWAVRKLVELVLWARTLPGRISAALGALKDKLVLRIALAFIAFRNMAQQKATSFISWVKGMPGRISRGIGSLTNLLAEKGRNVVQGLWNGIKGMGTWLKNKLIGFAKSIIPGPIAKALGISSPSKVMAKQVGRWIPPGIVAGAEGAQPAMQRSLRGLVDVPGLTSMTRNGAAGAAGQRVDLTITVDGPEAVKKLIRGIVREDGRGSVQTAFGTR